MWSGIGEPCWQCFFSNSSPTFIMICKFSWWKSLIRIITKKQRQETIKKIAHIAKRNPPNYQFLALCFGLETLPSNSLLNTKSKGQQTVYNISTQRQKESINPTHQTTCLLPKHDEFRYKFPTWIIFNPFSIRKKFLEKRLRYI